MNPCISAKTFLMSKGLSHIWRHSPCVKVSFMCEGISYVWRHFLYLKAFLMSEGIPYVWRLFWRHSFCVKALLVSENIPHVWRHSMSVDISYSEGIPLVWKHFFSPIFFKKGNNKRAHSFSKGVLFDKILKTYEKPKKSLISVLIFLAILSIFTNIHSK